MSLLAAAEYVEDCKGLCDVEMVEVLGPTVCSLHGTAAKAVPPTELNVTVPQVPSRGELTAEDQRLMMMIKLTIVNNNR
eukprot:Skav235885  [mRNA]  locus=scaffold5594:18894:20554:+ [translate_table: standard]